MLGLRWQGDRCRVYAGIDAVSEQRWRQHGMGMKRCRNGRFVKGPDQAVYEDDGQRCIGIHGQRSTSPVLVRKQWGRCVPWRTPPGLGRIASGPCRTDTLPTPEPRHG